ncbi:DUF4192 domain-containing protein [Nocardia asiatica]|uniref:DUF4192 domain-containing protein n=1 Tax=Nocardia asiatica TaxID=209252 RepID=UPI0002DEB50A|nr:DUF4192 domain-containing protein [Nocardia asiatica]
MHSLTDLVRDPTQVITSIPAWLGYIPHRQLVLTMLKVTTDRDTEPARLVVRSVVAACDLTMPVGEVAARARSTAASIDASATLAVIVDDRLSDPDFGPTLPAAGRRLVDGLAHRLADSSAPLIGGWVSREITAGSPWWTLIGSTDRGVLTDPARSPIALDRLITGQPVHPSRQALRDTLAPDPTLTEQIEMLLPAASARARQQRRLAVLHHDLTGYHRRCLQAVLWRIADIAGGDIPAPTQLAALAVALSERAVLDCLPATAVSKDAVAAEQLWTLLVRCLPGAARTEAATLLAYSAYLRGEGTLAAVALETALASSPRHATAMALRAALNAGVAPEKLRRLAGHGASAAAKLGIGISEPTS